MQTDFSGAAVERPELFALCLFMYIALSVCYRFFYVKIACICFPIESSRKIEKNISMLKKCMLMKIIDGI